MVGSERFLRYKAFYEVKEVGQALEGPKVCVTEWSYLKKQQYIYGRGGVLNGFWDVKP